MTLSGKVESAAKVGATAAAVFGSDVSVTLPPPAPANWPAPVLKNKMPEDTATVFAFAVCNTLGNRQTAYIRGPKYKKPEMGELIGREIGVTYKPIAVDDIFEIITKKHPSFSPELCMAITVHDSAPGPIVLGGGEFCGYAFFINLTLEELKSACASAANAAKVANVEAYHVAFVFVHPTDERYKHLELVSTIPDGWPGPENKPTTKILSCEDLAALIAKLESKDSRKGNKELEEHDEGAAKRLTVAE